MKHDLLPFFTKKMSFVPKPGILLYSLLYVVHCSIDSKLTNNSQQTEHKPPRNKTNKMARALGEDSDKPGYPPGLIRVFALRSVGSYFMRRAKTLIRLSLRWAHMPFCWFCHLAAHIDLNNQ